MCINSSDIYYKKFGLVLTGFFIFFLRIFSTMLGHKSSVPKVLQYLKEREIHEVASTEFCQGRVTRWGLAWSHVVTLRCESLSADQAGLKQKLKPPLRHEVSCKEGNYDSVHLKIKQLLLKLSVSKILCIDQFFCLNSIYNFVLFFPLPWLSLIFRWNINVSLKMPHQWVTKLLLSVIRGRTREENVEINSNILLKKSHVLPRITTSQFYPAPVQQISTRVI